MLLRRAWFLVATAFALACLSAIPVALAAGRGGHRNDPLEFSKLSAKNKQLGDKAEEVQTQMAKLPETADESMQKGEEYRKMIVNFKARAWDFRKAGQALQNQLHAKHHANVKVLQELVGSAATGEEEIESDKMDKNIQEGIESNTRETASQEVDQSETKKVATHEGSQSKGIQSNTRETVNQEVNQSETKKVVTQGTQSKSMKGMQTKTELTREMAIQALKDSIASQCRHNVGHTEKAVIVKCTSVDTDHKDLMKNTKEYIGLWCASEQFSLKKCATQTSTKMDIFSAIWGRGDRFETKIKMQDEQALTAAVKKLCDGHQTCTLPNVCPEGFKIGMRIMYHCK